MLGVKNVAAKGWKKAYTRFAVGNAADKNTLTAQESMNCVCCDGVLQAGLGTVVYRVGDGSTVLMPSATQTPAWTFFPFLQERTENTYVDTIAYITRENTLYIYNTLTDAWEYSFRFTTPMKLLITYDRQKQPYIYAVGKAGMYEYRSGGFFSIDATELSTKACVCRGRIFAVGGKYTLYYSSAHGGASFAETLRESGNIDFPDRFGAIVALTPFGDNLAVLFEHGISVLELGGSPQDFKRRDIAHGGKRIISESVATCGGDNESVVFLSDDGIYRFDGKRTEKVGKNMLVAQTTGSMASSCKGFALSGWYYVTYWDERTGWQGIAVDLETGEGYPCLGADPVGDVNGDVVFGLNGMLMRLRTGGGFNEPAYRYFKAKNVDFGVSGRKSLRVLRFYGGLQADVCVRAGLRSRSAALTFENGVAEMCVDLQAEAFDVEICVRDGGYVTGMVAEGERLVKK